MASRASASVIHQGFIQIVLICLFKHELLSNISVDTIAMLKWFGAQSTGPWNHVRTAHLFRFYCLTYWFFLSYFQGGLFPDAFDQAFNAQLNEIRSVLRTQLTKLTVVETQQVCGDIIFCNLYYYHSVCVAYLGLLYFINFSMPGRLLRSNLTGMDPTTQCRHVVIIGRIFRRLGSERCSTRPKFRRVSGMTLSAIMVWFQAWNFASSG